MIVSYCAGDPGADRRRAGAEAGARAQPRFQRVINTRALILQGGIAEQHFYIHVYDGWLTSNSIAGPWSQAYPGPLMANEMNRSRRSSRRPAPSTCSTAAPRPIRSRRSPTACRRSTRARCRAELIVFKGQPDFVPIVGTQLLWASNTTSDVLIDTANNNYYVLLAGRWFTSRALTGPWTFVASNALPADFAKIPPTVARRRRAADRRRHAAGAGSGDRELDSADGDGAAQGRADVHAEFRRPAAVPADRRHAAVVRRQLVGAGDPGRAERVLRGRRRRLVHRGAADRTVDVATLGARRRSTRSRRRRRSTT